MNFETISTQRKMILIAAAVGIISMFLPWFKLSISGLTGLTGFERMAEEAFEHAASSATVSGMHSWGILIFLCFVTAGALGFIGDQTKNLTQLNWMIVLIASGLAALIALIEFINPPLGLKAAYGLYIGLAAAIAIAAFTFMHRSATDSLQTGFDTLKNSFTNATNSAATNDPTKPTA